MIRVTRAPVGMIAVVRPEDAESVTVEFVVENGMIASFDDIEYFEWSALTESVGIYMERIGVDGYAACSGAPRLRVCGQLEMQHLDAWAVWYIETYGEPVS